MCHKVVQFFGLSYCDPMVLVFSLAPVQLVDEGCDVGVGPIAPCLEEVRLDSKL